LELRHLRYFAAVGETLNLSKACAIVNVTQPALTRQIKDLEDEIGVPLFVRHHSGMRLTKAGRVFGASVNRILSHADLAVREAREVDKKPVTQISVGFDSSCIAPWLFCGLHAFGQAFQETSVSLTEAMPRQLLVGLRAGSFDVCLISSGEFEPSADLMSQPLSKLRLRVLVNSGHRLALMRSVDLAHFEHEPLILIDDIHQVSVMKACRQAGFEPTVILRANSYVSMLAMVAAGQGYSLSVENPGVSKFNEICSIRLDKSKFFIEMSAIWLRGEARPSLAQFVQTMAGHSDRVDPVNGPEYQFMGEKVAVMGKKIAGEMLSEHRRHA
jgi:DNA-binding transcriptional LysR family regulator